MSVTTGDRPSPCGCRTTCCSGELDSGVLSWSDELAGLIEAGVFEVPEDPDAQGGRRCLDELDLLDDPTCYQMSRIDVLEWELWAGVEQDEAEKALLELRAPAWTFHPPGGELAAALEQVRPQTESPIALIELMKASGRLTSWSQAITMSAIAAFYRQRQAQAADFPRPSEIDSRGRPIDPERSWMAELAAALKLSPETVAAHVDTALRLTGVLTATHTALRCGAITLSKAIAISDATRSLTDAQAQAVEAHVLKRAAFQSHKNLRRSLRNQVAHYDAKNEAERHREAKAEREVRLIPLEDGMAGLWIVHTADKIQQMWIVIQAMADLAKRPTNRPAAGAAPRENSAQGGLADAAREDSAHARGKNSAPVLGENSAHLPGEGSAHVSEEGSAHPPREGSAHVPGEGIGRAPEDGSDRVPGEGSAHVPGEGVGRAPEDGSDRVPGEGSAHVPGEGFGHADGDGSAHDHRENSARVSRQGLVQTTQSAADIPDDSSFGEKRTVGQRRADVAVDLFEYTLWNGLDWLDRRLPDQHRRRPHIEVLIPVGTMLGLDDEPCQLTGYGPIPADLARTIATDGTWRRLLTDPTNGAVLEASTTRHDPGALVSETLLAAHPVCDWINCNRQARQCDRDHGTPFARTGTTSLADLRSYCEFHHVIKDTPAWGWTATNNADGSTTLTTPTGHRYTSVPPRPGPVANPLSASTVDDSPPF